MTKPEQINSADEGQSGSNAGLGVMVKFKELSSLADRKMGVTPGMGLPIVGLAFAVGLQWFFVLSQLFCQPCMQAIFAVCRLIELLL